MALTIEEFGARIKQQYPQYGDLSDRELGNKMLSKYPQYQDMISKNVYNVPENRTSKISELRAGAEKAKAESDKANSVGGFLGNFGAALGSTLFGSEVELGKTLQKTYLGQGKKFSDAEGTLTKAQVDAAKKIREMEAAGKDATRLKQLYNQNAGIIGEVRQGLGKEREIPTTGQVAGQLGGTALDILSAGTYGTAAAGMRTGVLGRTPLLQKIGTATPVAGQIGQIASRTPGLFSLPGLGSVAVGGAVGYGYDVTQGLQGNRGQDRTGANAFIPGIGTAVGAGVPFVAGAIQTGRNIAANAGKPGEDLATKLTQPTLTTNEKAAAIASRRLKDPGALKVGSLKPTVYDESVANAIRPYIKNQPVSKNIEAIADQISTKDSQIGQYIAKNKKSFTEAQLREQLNRGAKDLNLIFASEPAAKRTYSAVVNEFIKNLESYDTLGLFRARQDVDSIPAIKKLLENDKLGENMRREIVLAVRGAANDYITSQLGKNNPYSYIMQEQSLMLEAIDRIARNKTNLLDNSKLDLLVKRLPILKYIVGGALGAAGVGVGGAAISSL